MGLLAQARFLTIRATLFLFLLHLSGAIGKDAMLENGRLNPSTNLQVGTSTLTLTLTQTSSGSAGGHRDIAAVATSLQYADSDSFLLLVNPAVWRLRGGRG